MSYEYFPVKKGTKEGQVEGYIPWELGVRAFNNYIEEYGMTYSSRALFLKTGEKLSSIGVARFGGWGHQELSWLLGGDWWYRFFTSCEVDLKQYTEVEKFV